MDPPLVWWRARGSPIQSGSIQFHPLIAISISQHSHQHQQPESLTDHVRGSPFVVSRCQDLYFAVDTNYGRAIRADIPLAERSQ